MALVTTEINQQDQTRMWQLVQDFPEIPQHFVADTLLKNNGDVGLTRLALERESERILYQTDHTPSPTSPHQSPIRYPPHVDPYSPTHGSPSRSRTPSTPRTPIMDPFTNDFVLSTSGRGSPSPSPRPLQYQNVSNQPKQGPYTNLGNSPQHNYVSQLHVNMDRQSSRPSSRPTSGNDQDGQLINGTSNASSGSGTPTRTPTTDMPAPLFPMSPTVGACNTTDDFPTGDMLSITPTGPIDTCRTGPPPNERRFSPSDVRYPGDYPVTRYHNVSGYQRHPIDGYRCPIDYRGNGPDHLPHDMSGGVRMPFDPRSHQPYNPLLSPHHNQQLGGLHISQSVPKNLDGPYYFTPGSREPQYRLRNASSTHNIHLDQDRRLTPAEVHTPTRVATSSQIIHPSPHSPARSVTRPHSESYDPRDHTHLDGTRSLLVFPPDVREPKPKERPIPIAWTSPGPSATTDQTCISLPARTVTHDDDEYTQALLLHQSARYEKLLRDLNDEKRKLDQYRRQVADMETDLAHKSIRKSPAFLTAEQVNKLREEKRQLQIDIECMNREIELHKSQGLVSQAQHNNFYANMLSTGPSGPMPPKLPSQPGHMVSPQELHPPPTTLEPDEGQQWSCASCTFFNHPALDKCECCEMPRI